MHFSALRQVHALVKADSQEFLGANTLEGFHNALFFGGDLPLLLRRIESVHPTWHNHCLQQRYLIRDPRPSLAPFPGEPTTPAYVVNPDNPPPNVHLVRYNLTVDKVTPLTKGSNDANA